MFSTEFSWKKISMLALAVIPSAVSAIIVGVHTTPARNLPSILAHGLRAGPNLLDGDGDENLAGRANGLAGCGRSDTHVAELVAGSEGASLLFFESLGHPEGDPTQREMPGIYCSMFCDRLHQPGVALRFRASQPEDNPFGLTQTVPAHEIYAFMGREISVGGDTDAPVPVVPETYTWQHFDHSKCTYSVLVDEEARRADWETNFPESKGECGLARIVETCRGDTGSGVVSDGEADEVPTVVREFEVGRFDNAVLVFREGEDYRKEVEEQVVEVEGGKDESILEAYGLKGSYNWVKKTLR